ncbi:MAG TPA: hypothetical protein GX404_04550 [Syntrophomonadaceae bacterium]|nr:hypothetical protein [Syntrophomonadaceae bacterium]
MPRKTSWILSIILLLLLIGVSGCNTDLDSLSKAAERKEEPELIKVELIFTDQQRVKCYLKGLGIEEDGRVYIGGSSANYMYDHKGNIIGAFNYQRLIYIKVIPDTDTKVELP